MIRIVGDTNIDFIGKRKITFIISVPRRSVQEAKGSVHITAHGHLSSQERFNVQGGTGRAVFPWGFTRVMDTQRGGPLHGCAPKGFMKGERCRQLEGISSMSIENFYLFSLLSGD